ncbi:MAG: hypothetical protein M0Z54_14340 [Thermaerobacter sp.]|nr:hypothetical protein [Thermaerobacter sp.]
MDAFFLDPSEFQAWQLGPAAAAHHEQRRWADMSACFAGRPADGDDPVIYEVYTWPTQGSGPTDLDVSLTVLMAGRLGDEPFHTKGHFHLDPDGPEYVSVVSGDGILERATRSGLVESVALRRGVQTLVPAGWAHRVLNPGPTPLAFVSIASRHVGHDYAGVGRVGWVRP